MSEMMAVTMPVEAFAKRLAWATVTVPEVTFRTTSAAVSRVAWSSIAFTRSAPLPVMVPTAVALTGAEAAASIATRSAAAAVAPVTVIEVRDACPRATPPRARRSAAVPVRFAGPLIVPLPFCESSVVYWAAVSEASVISRLTFVRFRTAFTSTRPKLLISVLNVSRTTSVVAPVATLTLRTRFSDESVM